MEEDLGRCDACSRPATTVWNKQHWCALHTQAYADMKFGGVKIEYIDRDGNPTEPDFDAFKKKEG